MSKKPGSSFTYRPLEIQHDLPLLVQLFADVAEAEPTGESMSEDALREQLTWSGEDPARNVWVATPVDSASLLAFGQTQKIPSDPNADLHIIVHPRWRRMGIGSQISAHLLQRASQLSARALRAYTDVQDEGARLFAQAQGFEPAASYTRLSVPGTQNFSRPDLPEGFTIRTYDQVPDRDLYTEAMNRAYEGQWGHLHCTPSDVDRMLLSLDHTRILLLFAPDGSIAGTCRAMLHKDTPAEHDGPTALIDAPGIVPAYRNRDLSRLLLLAAIHRVLASGPATLELEAWGDAPDTLAQYRALGFRVIKEEISYRRTLER